MRDIFHALYLPREAAAVNYFLQLFYRDDTPYGYGVYAPHAQRACANRGGFQPEKRGQW